MLLGGAADTISILAWPRSGKPDHELVTETISVARRVFDPIIEGGRIAAARVVNQAMTTTYRLVGRQIVEHEQSGSRRAAYGEELIERLSAALTARFGRGFSPRSLEQMRKFYLWKPIPPTLSAESTAVELPRFPLPWSH
jgi:hypothetical protein